MKIMVYDEVDPLGVLQLNMLALEFALTPEHVAHIRRTDPRPLPFFAVYAVEAGQVLGQVGVFRLPMVTTEGREDVGGVWAVSTHPRFAGKGIATLLLDEAHSRMREAGLRFSTLGTNRYRVAYKLYQRHEYEDTQVLAEALGRWETAHQPTRLNAQPVGIDGFDFIERIFNEIAPKYLGFAWRPSPFAPMRDTVSSGDMWILRMNADIIGYAIAKLNKSILEVNNLFIDPSIAPMEAVSAIAAKIKATYVKVKLTRPIEIFSLQEAGFHIAHPTWGAFMLKPLIPEVSVEYAQQLFGIGTDRFLLSWLDLT